MIDHAEKKPKVVGTYRLLRQDVAAQHHGFYSAREFNIGPMLAAHPGTRFLELGRSCVAEPYRDKRTVELLWHGIGHYTMQHRPDVMMGCASLDGTDPDRLALQLSFLHHFAGAPEKWRASPLKDRAVGVALHGSPYRPGAAPALAKISCISPMWRSRKAPSQKAK